MKIIFMVFGVLIAAGVSQLNAQVLQEKELPFYFCGWVGCANGGLGEELCGTVYQHAVIHFDNNGNSDWFHFNYIKEKSIFIGQTSGEEFVLIGASNMGSHPSTSFEFNETIQLRGNKGTKAVVRTKYHYSPDGEFIMDMFFEKCK